MYIVFYTNRQFWRTLGFLFCDSYTRLKIVYMNREFNITGFKENLGAPSVFVLPGYFVRRLWQKFFLKHHTISIQGQLESLKSLP